MWKFQTLSVHCCWCLCFVPLLNACLLGPPAAAMPSRTHMSINAFPEMADVLVDKVIYCSAAVSVTSALTFYRSHSKHTFMTIWRWGTSLYWAVVFVSCEIDWCSLHWNKTEKPFVLIPPLLFHYLICRTVPGKLARLVWLKHISSFCHLPLVYLHTRTKTEPKCVIIFSGI